MRGSPVGPFLTRSMRPSRQELGAAGECSGIRRIGGCCGAPYSLWPLGRPGLLRMGAWAANAGVKNPGVLNLFPVFFNTT